MGFLKGFEKMLNTSDSKRPESSPVKWKDFLEKTEKDIDKRIISYAKAEALIFIGGKCRITATKSETGDADYIINVDVELYYKAQFTAEESFKVCPLHTEKPYSDFDTEDEETKEQLENLKTNQIELAIDKPQIIDKKE